MFFQLLTNSYTTKLQTHNKIFAYDYEWLLVFCCKFHFFKYYSICGIIISEYYCNFKKFDCFCRQSLVIIINKTFDIQYKLL